MNRAQVSGPPPEARGIRNSRVSPLKSPSSVLEGGFSKLPPRTVVAVPSSAKAPTAVRMVRRECLGGSGCSLGSVCPSVPSGESPGGSKDDLLLVIEESFGWAYLY